MTYSDHEADAIDKIANSKADFAHKLKALNACADAVDWALAQPDMQAAWDNCQRGDWMLWWAANFVDRRALVLAACDCAELVTDYADSAMQMLIVWTIETARMWACGEGGIDRDDVLAAAADITTARVINTASTRRATAAACATDAAAVAARATAAASTTDVGACAVHAANAAIRAVVATNIWSEAAADIWTETLSICADICREHWPLVPDKQGEE